MNKEISLEKIVTRDAHWSDYMTMAAADGMDGQGGIEQYGQELAAKVAVGLVSIKDLRQVVKWANILDGEAHHYSRGDISELSGDDLNEAKARRFAHHALKTALNQVNNWSQRNCWFAGQNEKVVRAPDLSNFGGGYLLE